MNAAGLCPRPLRLNGAVRWHVDELKAWAAAGTPSRCKWEESKPSARHWTGDSQTAEIAGFVDRNTYLEAR
jgi:hypothetical protein